MPTKLTAHIGGNFALSRYKNSVTTISPNFLYQKQQDFQQFNYWVYVKRGPIVGGLWARHSAKNIDSFESVEKNAIDLYASVKSLYLQNRNKKIANSTSSTATQDDSDWEEIDTQ